MLVCTSLVDNDFFLWGEKQTKQIIKALRNSTSAKRGVSFCISRHEYL